MRRQRSRPCDGFGSRFAGLAVVRLGLPPVVFERAALVRGKVLIDLIVRIVSGIMGIWTVDLPPRWSINPLILYVRIYLYFNTLES